MYTEIGTDILKAARFLNDGNLVAIPTETVYGLAANALNDDAVLEIYKVKQRPQFNPLILHVSSLEKAKSFVTYIPFKAQLLAQTFWPGPLTMLLEKNKNVSDLITAGSNKVAIRVPNHLLALELLNQINFPIAAPSANPSGYVSPTSATHVYENLHGKIPYILDGGNCVIGLESTILGWNEDEEPEIYRLGGITVEAIETVLEQKVKIKKHFVNNPNTPGQLKSHYATHTPLHIGSIEELMRKFEDDKIVLINFTTYNPELAKENQFILSPSGNIDEAAKNLFGILRLADNLKADVLLAELLPNKGLGIAINDRLERAQNIMK